MWSFLLSKRATLKGLNTAAAVTHVVEQVAEELKSNNCLNTAAAVTHVVLKVMEVMTYVWSLNTAAAVTHVVRLIIKSLKKQ